MRVARHAVKTPACSAASVWGSSSTSTLANPTRRAAWCGDTRRANPSSAAMERPITSTCPWPGALAGCSARRTAANRAVTTACAAQAAAFNSSNSLISAS